MFQNPHHWYGLNWSKRKWKSNGQNNSAQTCNNLKAQYWLIAGPSSLAITCYIWNEINWSLINIRIHNFAKQRSICKSLSPSHQENNIILTTLKWRKHRNVEPIDQVSKKSTQKCPSSKCNKVQLCRLTQKKYWVKRNISWENSTINQPWNTTSWIRWSKF